MEQTPSTPQPTEPPPPPQPITQPQSSSSSSLPAPSSAASPSPNPNPNPNPSQNPTPQHSVQNSQTRPPFNRPWQHQSSSPFSHFASLPSASAPAPSSSLGSSVPSLTASSASPTISVPPVQRGGIAIGVPAHHPSPPLPQSAPFSSLNSSSFGQQFAGLGRNSVNVPDSGASSSTSQVRQPIQGYQNIGMIGSLGSGSQVRPGGVSTNHQSRPVQPSVRPQSTMDNQSSATQNFQGHGLLRSSSVGSPGSPSPNTSQSMPSHNQPWLSSGSQGKPSLPSPSSSGSQGKPPLPSPSLRPQMNPPQLLQQRSHIPQQHHHSLPTASQPHQMSSSQQSQQPSPSHQQDNHAQQFAPFRAPQYLSHQQHITRIQGAGNQKPSSLAMIQPSTSQTGPQGRTVNAESGESCNRILSKRSIHELVNQIDPSETLDPEVEDILVDIADEFVESITTFGCSLAKHRKSSTLEAKDILLHLERNWNMTLPGFSGDEIKSYKKPIANDIHRERLAAIKKSMVGTEMANSKSSAGQVVGNAKGHLAKAPANAMES